MQDKSILLKKPTWTYKDIMSYFDVGHSKAYQIFNLAKNKYGGKVPSISNVVKRDSVLSSQSLDIERELYIKNLIERRNNEETLHKGKV